MLELKNTFLFGVFGLGEYHFYVLIEFFFIHFFEYFHMHRLLCYLWASGFFQVPYFPNKETFIKFIPKIFFILEVPLCNNNVESSILLNISHFKYSTLFQIIIH